MTGFVAKIVKDKGFGFIHGEDGKEYFFHRSGFRGHWQDLETDFEQKRVPVTFSVTASDRGPRADNVDRTDWPDVS